MQIVARILKSTCSVVENVIERDERLYGGAFMFLNFCVCGVVLERFVAKFNFN